MSHRGATVFTSYTSLAIKYRDLCRVTGVPSPVRKPGDVNMVIFRENSEDIYAGIEFEAESPEVKKVIAFLENEMKVKKIRFPLTSDRQ